MAYSVVALLPKCHSGGVERIKVEALQGLCVGLLPDLFARARVPEDEGERRVEGSQEVTRMLRLALQPGHLGHGFVAILEFGFDLMKEKIILLHLNQQEMKESVPRQI